MKRPIHSFKNHKFRYDTRNNRVVILSPELTVNNVDLNVTYSQSSKIDVYEDYIEIFDDINDLNVYHAYSVIDLDDSSVNNIIIWSNSDNGQLVETLLM